jgi:hypothetical protein
MNCVFVCVGPHKPVYCSLQAYCTYPMCVQCSNFHRQETPRHNDAGDPSSEMWNLLGEKCPVIWPKVASSMLLWGSFTCRKSTTWDRRLYFPSEGSRAEDFFALKNPNLCTKGQYVTPRPPKPLTNCVYCITVYTLTCTCNLVTTLWQSTKFSIRLHTRNSTVIGIKV